MARSRSRRRLSLDLRKVALIAVLVAVAARVVHLRREIHYSPELLWLRDAYGPARHSQHIEEWIIRDFFQDRRGGVFVDVDVGPFDLLRIDIELAEPKALAGFDIQRFRPRLVCIEGQPEIRHRLLDYFARHEYVIVGKYLRADDRNMCVMPMGAKLPPPCPDGVMVRWRPQE